MMASALPPLSQQVRAWICCLALATQPCLAEPVRPSAPNPAPTGLPATLPLKRGAEGTLASSGTSFLTFAVVVGGLAAAAIWLTRQRKRTAQDAQAGPDWLQRLLPPRTPAGIRVLQSSRLTPKASLHLVHWNGQEWLLGCSDHGISTIGVRSIEPSTPPKPEVP